MTNTRTPGVSTTLTVTVTQTEAYNRLSVTVNADGVRDVRLVLPIATDAMDNALRAGLPEPLKPMTVALRMLIKHEASRSQRELAAHGITWKGHGDAR